MKQARYKEPLPLAVIEAARAGDAGAVEQVLQYYNGRIAFAVEEDVRHPFAHAGNILVDPAGVQRLEDLLAPVHPAHCFSLKFRCLFRHDRTSFLCCDAQPALFIFVVLDLTKSCLLQIRFTVHNAMLFTRCAHCSG